MSVLLNVADLYHDPKIMNLNVTTNRLDSKNIVNIRFQLYDQLPGFLSGYFSFFEEINGKPVFMFDITGDLCYLGTYYRTHPFLRFIATRLMKASSFPTSCPPKKVSHEI